MSAATPIFSGTHSCLVDDKGRLTIPKSMRVQVPTSQEKYWVTIMIPERCVAVYPEEQWDAVYQKHVNELITSGTPENRERFRAILEKTYAVKADTQGRFRVHPALIRVASLEGPLLAIGSGDHVEYWALDRRQKYARSLGITDDDYLQFADTVREEGETDEGDR